jgi:hypothetical protein
LQRPFLYDRYFFVSVNLLGSCSAGFALKPCGLSSSGGLFRAAVPLTFRSAARALAKNADLKVGATLAWPRRPKRVAMEEPPAAAG